LSLTDKLTRRQGLCLAGGAAASVLLPGRAGAYPTIPQRASARVIVDNDFAGDPDSLIALAHQLLSPKTRTVLVTSSALDAKFPGPVPAGTTAAAGREMALELIRRGKFKASPPVVAGSEVLGQHGPTDAARAIVAEAMRDDKLPLFFTCGGPLTNLAAALALEPRIASRMTVIWIGGGNYPAGGWEYNLAGDADAARKVIEQSPVPLWQVPQGAYRQMAYSVAEMREQLRPVSPFGRWLYERFTTPPDFIDVGGSWPLGDSPTVLLSAITSESSRFVDVDARRIAPDFHYGEAIAGRKLRVFETLDARLTFGDFLSLMRLHARGEI
jgi:hypothetical protein